jgi:glutathione S-transferase
MSKLTLFYTPSACSIGPHIALREAGVAFALARVDLRAKQLVVDAGESWLALNPKGYVPALRLANGELLTEGAVIVQYIADQVPEQKLIASAGTLERYRHQEWLNFIATELHKGMSPFYSALAGPDYRTSILERLHGRLDRLADGVRATPWIGGDRFTVIDGYAFYVLRTWQHVVKQDFTRWPVLGAYYARLVARPSISAALEAEGIKA